MTTPENPDSPVSARNIISEHRYEPGDRVISCRSGRTYDVVSDHGGAFVAITDRAAQWISPYHIHRTLIDPIGGYPQVEPRPGERG